ncbi:LacI family DNA-binding transcriptional regulator [Thermostaphylospora chromogena]|uniref:Transcriptional regulator, LacI family n=1 Tax=Thermostaphylospora chromogena TaxID=35622 RepID=A0A1H1HS33_9ACTN|nr:LacI family DNA-binding transcriptional regulator [Thermostaphylospora chromogena]SDR28280.1 transcriptional regulator, LacI family [Thermostaphylospora chromogena]
MGATIRDVARAAGVSPSTVSRALAMSDLVSPATIERVRRAAASLGYEPNPVARGLITGRTGNLGMIVPDLGNPFFPGVVKGVQARAREADYAVFVADTDEDAALEARLVRKLAKQVDALVLCSSRLTDDELRAVAADVALVLLNRKVDDIPAIVPDNADGMRQAIAHLAALGHRRVGVTAGPVSSWTGSERVAGLRAAARTAGVDLVELGNFAPTFQGGVAAADIVLAAGVSAVVAYNDVMALGLMNRFAARGVSVPADISVVGCDDIPLAAMSNPPLTTVAVPKEPLGRAGVDLVRRLLEREEGLTPRLALDTQLLVRGTTGPVRPG